MALQIVFIGAGNVATQLAKAFRKQSFDIAQVYSRTAEAAETLASQVGAEGTNSFAAVRRQADLYVCAVKDDALPETLAQLADCQGTFIHTAGSVPLNVFEGLFPHYGVFYPLQTFSKNHKINFSNIPVFVEASDRQTGELLTQTAQKISRNVLKINSEQRARLHLAAVFACNFTNRMYALAAEQLEGAGVPFEMLLPLIDETARKMHTLMPREAQTGPALRYDKTIIDKQAAMIADQLTRDIYLKMSESIYSEKLQVMNYKNHPQKVILSTCNS